MVLRGIVLPYESGLAGKFIAQVEISSYPCPKDLIGSDVSPMIFQLTSSANWVPISPRFVNEKLMESGATLIRPLGRFRLNSGV